MWSDQPVFFIEQFHYLVSNKIYTFDWWKCSPLLIISDNESNLLLYPISIAPIAACSASNAVWRLVFIGALLFYYVCLTTLPSQPLFNSAVTFVWEFYRFTCVQTSWSLLILTVYPFSLSISYPICSFTAAAIFFCYGHQANQYFRLLLL